MREYWSPPRSTSYAEHGMACTSHPHASLAAIETLKRGGNAMDAAIAAAATLAVVEPLSTGVGGDVFCLYAPHGSSKIVAYNGSGSAPMAAHADWYLDQGIRTIEPESAHAVTIPGCVDAWCRLAEDHGTMPMSEILAPAIGYAENGYTVHPVVHQAWARAEQRITRNANAAKLLLVNGKAPSEGAIHAQPELGATLRKIAEQGRDGFYTGAVAEDIVSYLKSLGGLHELDDFARANGAYVDTITTDLDGYTVHECPPNGQGIVALLMLNILKGYDLENLHPLSADRIHLTLEAGRRAFRDREQYVGDPEHEDVPIDQLISGEYAETLRESIDPARASTCIRENPLPTSRDTVYLCVVDKDRNAASFINSIYFSFGSTLTAPKSGVVLHNRGLGFSIKPGDVNCIKPGKRPMHTIIPAMLTHGERTIMPFGVMGGDYQPWGHTHVIQNMLLYGMDPQQALDLPRFCHDQGMAVVEPSVPDDTVHELANRGHTIATTDELLGGGQIIRIDWDRGVLVGGTEPRKDGIALGY